MGRTAAAILLALCLMLPGCLTGGGSEDPPVVSPYHGEMLVGEQYAPLFTLEAMDGTLWHLEEQQGSVVVLAFIYTRCEATCPIVSASLDHVRGNLDADDAANVTFVSVTMDPWHDSPSVLENWTADRGYEWLHLTGSPEAIQPILDAYGVDPIDFEDDSEEGYGFTHTQPTWIIDRGGMARVVWTDANLPPDLFNGDLQTVLEIQPAGDPDSADGDAEIDGGADSDGDADGGGDAA